jgi:class 3 adenylate cyclase
MKQLEAAFRRRRLHQLEALLRVSNLWLVGTFCVTLFSVSGIVANDADIRTGLRVVSGIAFPFMIMARRVQRRWPLAGSAMAYLLEAGFTAFLAAVARRDLVAHNPGAMASSFAVVATIIYVVGLSPGNTRRMLAHCVTCFAIGLWTVWPWLGVALQFVMVLVCSIGAAAAARLTFFKAIADEGVVELELLEATAPRSVVRQVGESLEPVSTIFSARERRCVCLSSDWRGYQKLSSQLTPAELARTLAAYYDLCEELLMQAAPEGDYYFDWIADELFVVFFDLSAEQTRDLAARALAFAERLVLAKAEFVRQYPAPAGIDIGIGAGTALVGMLGAPGMSKVTAAGPMQGLVRQLQTEAKGLRAQHGDCDRIVFGSELLAAAPAARAVPGRPGLFYKEPLAPAPLKSAA